MKEQKTEFNQSGGSCIHAEIKLLQYNSLTMPKNVSGLKKTVFNTNKHIHTYTHSKMPMMNFIMQNDSIAHCD